MQKFTVTKSVNAKPMNRADYNILRGWELPSDEDGTDEGYLVEDEDSDNANIEGFSGYVSWSPQKMFDKSYRECETHMQRMAIEAEELNTKMRRLMDFSGSTVFASLTSHEKALLLDQYEAMNEYLVILRKRFSVMINGEAAYVRHEA
jgi:hypothetical protein